MSRNGTGGWNRTIDWTSERDLGNNIDSTKFDVECDDFAAGLAESLSKDGQTTPTANLKMGGFKMTGAADGTLVGDLATVGQVQSGANLLLGSVGGTVDAITAAASPAITAYVAGQTFRFLPSGANTTAVTIAINGLAAKAVTKRGATALEGGNIGASTVATIIYDGTQFQLLDPVGVEEGTWELVEEQSIGTDADLEISHGGIDLGTPEDFIDGYTYVVEIFDSWADGTNVHLEATLYEGASQRTTAGYYQMTSILAGAADSKIADSSSDDVIAMSGQTNARTLIGLSTAITPFYGKWTFYNLASTTKRSSWEISMHSTKGGVNSGYVVYGWGSVWTANLLEAAKRLNIFPTSGNLRDGYIRLLRKRDST